MSVQKVGDKTVPINMVEPSTLDISLIGHPFQMHTRIKLFLKEINKE